MGILNSQKINEYYARYKGIDVTFSKEIIQVTGLNHNQVYLKCVGDFWPCFISTTSFLGARIVVSLKSGLLQKLEKANNMVSLRFCFKNTETGNPVTFFVNTKSTGYSPYSGSQDMALFNLQFTQRPPDDLIEIMGRVLDANVNSAKRREDRIMISPEAARKLNIYSKESAVYIQGVPRHCILRDISFSGAKLIMMGVAKFLVNKDVALRMDFDDPRESFLLKGKFIRSEAVEGRKELVALAVLFEESLVPMSYKIRINDYISQVRANERGSEKISVGTMPAKKPVPAAEPAAKPDPANENETISLEEIPADPVSETATSPLNAEAGQKSAKPETESPDNNFDLNFPSN